MRIAPLALLAVSMTATATTTTPTHAADTLTRPFGIVMAQKISTLDQAVAIGPARYAVHSVPEPHPLLPQYRVIALQEVGVCAVQGIATSMPKEQADEVIATLVSHMSEVFNKPAYAPTKLTVGFTGLWTWMPAAPGLGVCVALGKSAGADLKECLAGFPPLQSPLKYATLYRHQGRDGRVSTMLDFTFSNDKSCAAGPAPNPFR